MHEGIGLLDIFQLLWKNRYLIVASLVISIVIAGAVSFLASPTYQISSIIFLGDFNDTVYNDIDSVKVLLTSDGFLSEVLNQLSFKIPDREYSSFKDRIEIEPVINAKNLLVISYISSNGTEGKEILDAMIRTFTNRSMIIYNIKRQTYLNQMASIDKRMTAIDKDINQTRKMIKILQDAQDSSSVETELRISRTLEYLADEEKLYISQQDRYSSLEMILQQFVPMKVVQEPKKPVSPIPTKVTLNFMVAGLLGMMIGIFAAFLREGLRR